MTDEIRFEDPPPSRRGAMNWPGIAQKAKTRPGQWLCVPNQPTSVAGGLRAGKRRGFRGLGDWEVTQRSRGDDRVDVYVRYIGPGPGPTGALGR